MDNPDGYIDAIFPDGFEGELLVTRDVTVKELDVIESNDVNT